MINSPKPLRPTQFCVPLHSAKAPTQNSTTLWLGIGLLVVVGLGFVLVWVFLIEIDASAEVVGSGLL